ncbi:SDR family oxidoreductase [Thermosynechococcus sp. QKsg1]|uniref:SDR family NAD(P)-dependent oxidoreductase n=1 Tax=Thermosynechococcus sp. QKsg1 TaxID=3074130 RepID=UPI0028773359|nr:SDR family oxidoreductase [Thermosynechococcus sp. QKsg1]WNC87283.1 SDR family oxidoreductase [Thermosynechococcus sp. QKsg1]
MATTLITGATGGLGQAFAQALADRQHALILTGRRLDTLEELKTQLSTQVPVVGIPQDLSEPNAALRLYEQIQSLGLTVDVLVNNAGFGDYGAFGDRDRQQLTAMLQVNITALVELTHLVLQEMRSRRQGTIINVSSIAACQPLPYLAVYAASKAFVRHFSEALWAEVKPLGIRVLGVCPGPTATDFFERADMLRNPALLARQDTPEQVVAETLAALQTDVATVIPGQPANRFLALAGRLVPRQWLVQQLEPRFRPPTQ